MMIYLFNIIMISNFSFLRHTAEEVDGGVLNMDSKGNVPNYEEIKL